MGRLVQFVGDLHPRPAPDALCTLTARVARVVDGLDLGLYEEALQLRRSLEARICAAAPPGAPPGAAPPAAQPA